MARVCVERFGFDGHPPHRRRAHACGPALPVLVEQLAALGVDLSLTTNGATFRAAGRRPGPGRAATGQHLLRLAAAGPLRGDHPPRRAPAGARRASTPPSTPGSPRSRSTACSCEASTTTRWSTSPPSAGNGAWSSASSSSCPSTPTVPGRPTRWFRPTRSWRPSTPSTPSSRWPPAGPSGPVEREPHPEPAERYRYRDGGGEIGVIASVTRPFCGNCDRVRLTAEGMFRNCLFAMHETDLRAVLRSGGSDDDLAAAIAADVGTKWAGHSIGQVQFARPTAA